MADKSYWVELRSKRRAAGVCLACGREKTDQRHIDHVRKSRRKHYRSVKAHPASPAAIKRKAHKRSAKAKKAQANRDWLSTYRVESGCAKCGERHPACLEFHHRDQAVKEMNLSRSCWMSAARILEEVAKCDVLCANCHKKLHWAEKSGPWAKSKERV